MQLGELLADLPDAQARGPTDIEISGIAYDSRAVRPGNLFVAIGGFHVDGHAYIPQALEHGAAAVVGEKATGELPLPPELPYVRISNARTALAPIAAAFYGHPGRQMRVVGITGTDGKTTTTFLTSAVLEAGGHTTGMIGTVDFKLAARQWANDTRQSTPEAPEVQAMLREMADAGCDYAVLESTSHALSARWNRLGGAQFDVAVLTNVTHEHLDFHGSVEQYRRDKVRLFEMLGERPLSVVSSQLQGATDNRQRTTISSGARLQSSTPTIRIINCFSTRRRHVPSDSPMASIIRPTCAPTTWPRVSMGCASALKRHGAARSST